MDAVRIGDAVKKVRVMVELGFWQKFDADGWMTRPDGNLVVFKGERENPVAMFSRWIFVRFTEET